MTLVINMSYPNRSGYGLMANRMVCCFSDVNPWLVQVFGDITLELMQQLMSFP